MQRRYHIYQYSSRHLQTVGSSHCGLWYGPKWCSYFSDRGQAEYFPADLSEIDTFPAGFAVSQHLRPSGDPVSDPYHDLPVSRLYGSDAGREGMPTRVFSHAKGEPCRCGSSGLFCGIQSSGILQQHCCFRHEYHWQTGLSGIYSYPFKGSRQKHPWADGKRSSCRNIPGTCDEGYAYRTQ